MLSACPVNGFNEKFLEKFSAPLKRLRLSSRRQKFYRLKKLERFLPLLCVTVADWRLPSKGGPAKFKKLFRIANNAGLIGFYHQQIMHFPRHVPLRRSAFQASSQTPGFL